MDMAYDLVNVYVVVKSKELNEEVDSLFVMLMMLMMVVVVVVEYLYEFLIIHFHLLFLNVF
jgi:hypothetical protein